MTPRITVVPSLSSVKGGRREPALAMSPTDRYYGVLTKEPLNERWPPVACVCLLLVAFCVPGLVAIPAPPVAPAPSTVSLTKKLGKVIDGPDYKHASWGILV